ncbi:hypothetical protein GGR58DRAFT_504643 [Xylaria digitata]|nr:hypothetical protein GGR58DRAFT_504643 [Xylaria digitata]
MPSQIVAPVPVTPPRKGTRVAGSSDLFASLNASLESKANRPSTPIRSIQERDWDVPAPPPPSPVSFHPDHWQHGVTGIAQGKEMHSGVHKSRGKGVHGSLFELELERLGP